MASANHGFVCYSPVQYVKRFNRRFRCYRIVPSTLLPGYLLVKTNDLRPFLNFPQPHVFGPLRNADRSFAVLRGHEVEALRAYESVVVEASLPHDFRSGHVVRARSGSAFDAFKAVVLRLEGLTGVIVNLSLFGRDVEARFEAEALELA